MKKLNIVGVKCKEKIYISRYENNYDSDYSLTEYIINGKKPKTTFHKGWNVVDAEVVTVQKTCSQPDINHRYELIDKSMESERTPLVFMQEDVAEYHNYEWSWKKEYQLYESLYELVKDKQPDILKDCEFTYKTIMEVDEVRQYDGFSYSVQKTQWSHEGTMLLTQDNVKHQLIDKIVFPEILLPGRPCSLTPKESFKIVRGYVKQHINYDYATITSDYDFCFTVQKKIALSEPKMYEVDVNNTWFSKRKRKPKIETRYRKYRTIECFNMAPKSYQDYSVIQGFRGDNQEDLKANIDDYLKNLIEFINRPVFDCPHCQGTGVEPVERISCGKGE